MSDSNGTADHDDFAAKCTELEREIRLLRSLLATHGIAIPSTEPNPPKTTPPAPSALKTPQKIALFRSLFRGRDDVYARRWESPDGRHGYSPHTERDWRSYYAAKPEDRKRVDKETRRTSLSTMMQSTRIFPASTPSASIRCCSTKHAVSWPSTSTRKPGRRTLQRFGKHARHYACLHQ